MAITQRGETMTTFHGEEAQIQCVDCSSVVEGIDPCYCKGCGAYFCMGCFDAHECPNPGDESRVHDAHELASTLIRKIAPDRIVNDCAAIIQKTKTTGQTDGLAEAASILNHLPLDYRTEDEHESLERFVESATFAILRRYVELGGPA